MLNRQVGSVQCLLRPGTSDEAAFEENLASPKVEKHLTVEAGQKWFDFGGYIGTFSLFLLSRGCSVCFVEADPTSVEQAKENFLLNETSMPLESSRLLVLNHAVFADPPSPTVPLYVGNRGKGRQNLWANSVFNRWKRPPLEKVCSTIAFNKVVALAKRKFGAGGSWNLKLDIEGCEIDILERCSLEGFDQLYFEYHFQGDPSVERARNILKRVESLGFSVKLDRKLPKGTDPKHWRETIFTAWAKK